MARPAVLLTMINRTAACFAILLMALCSGCGNLEREGTEPESAEPTYGIRAPEEFRGACEAAASRWEVATGLVFSCTEGRRLLVESDCPDGYGGWSNDNGITVCDFMLDRLDIALAHEMGHQFAPGGHPQNGSLMCWKPVADAAPISAEDLSWVCERADCTWFQPEGYALATCPEAQ